MNANKKLYIIDDNRPFAESLKRGLQGKEIELYSKQKWFLREEEIEILPDDETYDLERIVNRLRKEKNSMGVVLINANLKFNESDRRIDRRGIRLTELIRMDLDLEFPIVLMSMESHARLMKDAKCSRLLRYDTQQVSIQIPFHISGGRDSLVREINTVCKEFVRPPMKIRKSLAQKLLVEAMEKMNSDFRHSFRDEVPTRSAVRVFLGALQAGDIDVKTGKSVLRRLVELEKERGGNPRPAENYDWDLLKRYLFVYNKTLRSAPKHKTLSRKVLFIDDECRYSGWTECLSVILALKNIEVVAEPSLEAALNLLKPDGEEDAKYEFDFVLLDLFLGKNQPSGLEALRLIKEKQFMLPVVVFTALDDSQVVKRCLELGAQGYFVKELRERKDRDSLKYYEKLKEVINDVIRDAIPRADVVQLWRRFAHIEEKLDALDRYEAPKLLSNTPISAIGTVPDDGISDCLRKAFYFLSFVHSGDCRTNRLLGEGSSTLARECVVYAVSVLHRMLVYRLGADSEKGIDDLLNLCIQKKRLGKEFAKYNGHWAHERGFGRHYFLRTSEVTRLEHNPIGSCIDCIEHVLEFAEEYLKLSDIASIARMPSQKSSKRTSSNELKEDQRLLEQAINRQRVVDNHRTVARMGARGLDIGKYFELGGNRGEFERAKEKYNDAEFDGWLQDELKKLIKPKSEKKYPILLIDDRPTEDNWQRSLENILGDLGYQGMLRVYGKEEITSGLDVGGIPHADLILLDLYIPKVGNNRPLANNGLRLLKEIKQRHFAVPVVMLTASNEARQVLRSFRRGALDYFVKGIPMDSIADAVAHYNNFEIVLGEALKKGVDSPEQNIWLALRYFEISEELPDFKSEYAEQIRKKWHLNKKSSVSSQIHLVICNLLKQAYYWFTIDQRKFEQWKVQRLIFQGRDMLQHQVRSVFWYCGMAIEIYLKLWTLVESTMINERTGLYLDLGCTAGQVLRYAKRLPSTLQDVAQEIWEARNSALYKPALVVPDREECAKHFKNTINFFTKMRHYFQSLYRVHS